MNKDCDRDIEISRLEFQEKYCRELRLHNKERKYLMSVLAKADDQLKARIHELANANIEIEDLRTQVLNINRASLTVAADNASQLAALRDSIADKERLNKALLQELLVATEKLKDSEAEHAVRSIIHT